MSPSAKDGSFRRAVVDTLLRTHVPAASAAVAEEVRRFVDEQLARAPRYVAAGVHVVEVWLGTLSGPPSRRFQALDAAAQDAALDGWQTSPLPPVRAYLRLMRSLVLLCGYELQPAAASSS